MLALGEETLYDGQATVMVQGGGNVPRQRIGVLGDQVAGGVGDGTGEVADPVADIRWMFQVGCLTSVPT